MNQPSMVEMLQRIHYKKIQGMDIRPVEIQYFGLMSANLRTFVPGGGGVEVWGGWVLC